MSFARYDEGSEMDEQKRTDSQEEQERKIDDLEVPEKQGEAVKGGMSEMSETESLKRKA